MGRGEDYWVSDGDRTITMICFCFARSDFMVSLSHMEGTMVYGRLIRKMCFHTEGESRILIEYATRLDSV